MSDASAAPTPTAAGTLASRPFSHLLVYARTKRLSGKLVLQAPDGRAGAIALWRGQIAAARTAPPIAFFGAVATELGFVDAATSAATQREAAEKKRLHGEILIERGKLTGARRDAVLAEQTCRKVHHLFALPPPTAFAYYEERPRDTEPPFTLDPIAPLWRGIRDGSSRDNLRDVLAPFLSGALQMVNEAPLARAALAPDEKAITEALVAKPMSIAQMRRAFASVAPERIDRLVYLMLLTKCVEPTSVSATAGPPVGSAMRSTAGSMDADAIAAALKGSLRPAAMPSAPPTATLRNSVAPAFPSVPLGGPKVQSTAPARMPTSSSIAPAAVAVVGPTELGAAAIAKRAETVEDEDPFVTLGLAADASPDTARATYFRLVKLWHPDRLPADLASVRNEVAKIFAQMTSAHHTLTDAEARRTFLNARADRAAVLKRPRKDVIRLIDTALSKKDWSFAGDESRKLVAADRDDAEALALVAWIGSLAAEGPEPAIRSALAILDRAVAIDSQCARAHFYRAMINKRLGDVAAAYRDFSRVLKLDPKHVDATREVRIYEMRMKKKT